VIEPVAEPQLVGFVNVAVIDGTGLMVTTAVAVPVHPVMEFVPVTV
jgi:hypothetical protein